MACSRITIDSLVGIAISSIGAHEPARYLPKAHRPAQGEVFERLLRRFGHPAEAIWVANQLDFGQKRRQTISRAIQLADPVSAFTGWGRLLTFWIAGVLLLGNAICLLLVGGLSTIILKRAERIGLLAFLLLPAGAAALVAYLWFLTGGSDGLLKGDSLAVLLPLAVSGLVAFLSGIVSLIRRVPLLTGITRGVAAAAVPVASLLILAYAILAPFAAAVDRKMARATLQQIQNETQYNASLVHEKWPTQSPP